MRPLKLLSNASAEVNVLDDVSAMCERLHRACELAREHLQGAQSEVNPTAVSTRGQRSCLAPRAWECIASSV